MRIVVTVGASFIGSNVAAAYLRGGHRVTVLDSLARPGTERIVAWLGGLPGAERLEIVRGDVRDAGLVGRLVGADAVRPLRPAPELKNKYSFGWLLKFVGHRTLRV